MSNVLSVRLDAFGVSLRCVSPADWGWTRQGDVWQIFWTSNLPIADRELLTADPVWMQQSMSRKVQMLWLFFCINIFYFAIETNTKM